jgi:hypothetical protein
VLVWFRRHRSLPAIVVLATLAAMGASQLVPHEDDCHEAGCLPVAVEHDASAHRMGGAKTDTHGHQLHCLACDWVRTFRPRAEVAFQALPAMGAGASAPVDVFAIALATLAAQPPLRSPPASPVLA